MYINVALTACAAQAGDWALDRWGAIFLQGTVGAKIDSCTFDRSVNLRVTTC